MKKISLSLSALLLCTQVYGLESVELDKIQVTTTSPGENKNIEDVQASVQVLDQKYIEKYNARSLPQLLNNAVGITINDTGSTSSVSLRGFSSNHTLILIDGLRITGKYGSSDLTSIQLEDIEKIEIVRGPMSALYGADAIAGVVNIITKKGAKKDYIKATILGGIAQNGQRDTYITKINGAKVQKNITHNYSVELREKEDYRLVKSSVANDLKDESRQFLSYANNINLDDSNKLNTRLEYSRQDDYGKNSTNIKTFEKENRYQASTNFNHVNENFIFDSKLAYGYSDADVNRGTGLETTDYKQLEFNNYLTHYTTDNMTNILGAGAKTEEIDVSMYSKSASRDNYNSLFQNEYEILDNLTTVAGIRYDKYDDFGTSINPKLSLLYKLNDFNFRTSYGEAFKAPTFTYMYSNFTRSSGIIKYDISGNEDLKPEESKTYEYAVNYKKNKFDFDVIHHRTKLDNLINSYNISYTPSTKTYKTSYKNISKATINGTEISTKYSFDNGFGLNLGWEYLDTEDEIAHTRLTGSAKTTDKIGLSYEMNKLGAYLDIKKYNDYFGTNESRLNVNTDYTIADLRLNYKLSKTLEWFSGIDNIQDKQMPYNMTSRGTPNDPGERFYYTGMKISFE
jgi:outer membrane cobalamin receptor